MSLDAAANNYRYYRPIDGVYVRQCNETGEFQSFYEDKNADNPTVHNWKHLRSPELIETIITTGRVMTYQQFCQRIAHLVAR